jgi:uncharacterized membrane protein YqjE
MAEPAVQHQPNGARDQSLGSLVSQAISDVSMLLKSEIDLAKLELKADVRRLAIAGALMGAAAFVGCLILVLLCFAYAYGLQAVGVWPWLSFIYVVITCALLAALAVAIGYRRVRKLSGLRRTRQTVQDDLTLLKREDGAAAEPAADAR